MSLINQVLRDLDRRRADAAAVPSAVKAPPAVGVTTRARTVALSAALAIGLATVAGALAWNFGARSARAAAPAAAVAQPTIVREPTPVVVVTAPPVAPASHPEPAPPTPTVHAAKNEVWPTRLLASAPQALVANEPTAAAAPTVPRPVMAGAAGEARIEKRSSARTAHERAEAHYQRGIAAHQQDQWTDAATAYAAALDEEAGLASARQALAGILIGQGRADDAKALLTEGLALAPQHAGIAMMLARVHAEHGDLQRAADILQTAATAFGSPEDHAFHAAILQRLNRHADAAELYAAALRVTPGNGVWWMGLGMSLAADGRNDAARDAFKRARSSGMLSPELTTYVDQRLRQLI